MQALRISHRSVKYHHFVCTSLLRSKGEKQCNFNTRNVPRDVHSLSNYSSSTSAGDTFLQLKIRAQQGFKGYFTPCRLFGMSHVTYKSNSQPLTAKEIKKAVDTMTDQFMEARDLLQDARESLGTVYFSEDMEDAHKAVTETLEYYENLLNQLSPEQKQDVTRTIGLKMEELKAQVQVLKDEAST